MDKAELVCLCDLYDLKAMFGPTFEKNHSWLRLVNPDEVADPEKIRHAFVFSPGEDAFRPYPNLRLVSSAGAGINSLLQHSGIGPDVMISRAKIGEQAEMIAAFAMWHIIGWQRKLLEYPALQSRREWKPINRRSPVTFPIGVLGFGLMGGTLARRLRDLDYPVTAYGSKSRNEDGIEIVSGPEGLMQIASSCCAVVNLLPLTDATLGILSQAFFAAMRDDALLVNLGRGEHLVEADLIAALRAGRPALAALDAFSVEPLPTDHPFWGDTKIMITPHVAGDADPASVADFVSNGIAQFEKGERPAGFVDRNRGY